MKNVKERDEESQTKTNNYYSCQGGSELNYIQEEEFKNEWLNQKSKCDRFIFEYSTGNTDSFVIKTEESYYQVPFTKEEFDYFQELQVIKQEYFVKRDEIEYKEQWNLFQEILKENENKDPLEWDFEWTNTYKDRDDRFSINLLSNYTDSYKRSVKVLENRKNGKDHNGNEITYQNYVYQVEERGLKDEFEKLHYSVIQSNRETGTPGQNLPVWESWIEEKTGRKNSKNIWFTL
jgi:hypothetical protein